MQHSFIVLDIETTGIRPLEDRITEIGAVKVENREIVDTYKQLINPRVIIPQKITEITGITNEMVDDQPVIEEVIPEFIEFCGEHVIVGHNINFDYSFLKVNANNNHLDFEKKAIDTLAIARKTLKDLPSRSLESLCIHYSINRIMGHRAYDDALATYELFYHLYEGYYESHKELFKEKMMIYHPPKVTPATPRQLKYLKALIRFHRVDLDMDIERLTKSQASRYIDQIINKYGRKTS